MYFFYNGEEIFQTNLQLVTLNKENNHGRTKESAIYVDYDTENFQRILNIYRKIKINLNDSILSHDLDRMDKAINCDYKKINVQGKHYTVGVETLKSIPYVKGLLNFNEMFIDRDPNLFKKIISYIRNPNIILKKTDQLLEEFDFYCIKEIPMFPLFDYRFKNIITKKRNSDSSEILNAILINNQKYLDDNHIYQFSEDNCKMEDDKQVQIHLSIPGMNAKINKFYLYLRQNKKVNMINSIALSQNNKKISNYEGISIELLEDIHLLEKNQWIYDKLTGKYHMLFKLDWNINRNLEETNFITTHFNLRVDIEFKKSPEAEMTVIDFGSCWAKMKKLEKTFYHKSFSKPVAKLLSDHSLTSTFSSKYIVDNFLVNPRLGIPLLFIFFDEVKTQCIDHRIIREIKNDLTIDLMNIYGKKIFRIDYNYNIKAQMKNFNNYNPKYWIVDDQIFYEQSIKQGRELYVPSIKIKANFKNPTLYTGLRMNIFILKNVEIARKDGLYWKVNEY